MHSFKALELQHQILKAQQKLEAKLNEVEQLEQQITRLRSELDKAKQEPEQQMNIDLEKLYKVGGRL